jgi:hypothetical protein
MCRTSIEIGLFGASDREKKRQGQSIAANTVIMRPKEFDPFMGYSCPEKGHFEIKHPGITVKGQGFQGVQLLC